MKSVFFLNLFLFSVFSTLVRGADAEADKEWPDARGNAAMIGVSPVTLRPPLQLVWQEPLLATPMRGETLVATPVIRDGKVYVGCKDDQFHCLDLESGKKIWTAKGGGSFEGAAAFAGPLVIAGCVDGFVYAWKADTGEEVWKFETEGEVRAAANVWTPPDAKETRIYIGSYDYNVYCLDAATGKKLWAAPTGYYVNGGAAIGEGSIVFGGCDSILHVHDAVTGEEKRQIEVGSYIGNNVAVADGIIYVSHYGNRVAAYNLADGAEVWQYGEREFEFYSAPAIHKNWVVVGGRDKRLHGIDRATGKGVWEFRARSRVDSSPVICGGTHVIVGSDDGYLYAVTLADGKEIWSHEIGAAVRTSPAITEEWVVVGADDGNLYGFRNPPPKLEVIPTPTSDNPPAVK